MPIAVVTLTFDPILHLGAWSIPWETVGIGASILLALVSAALLAGRPDTTDSDGDLDVDLEGDEESPGRVRHRGRLRRDDVLLIALGALPGAVAGARLAYALVHLDYYSATPSAIVDPSLGSVSVSGAVVGGTLTGAVVAHLLGPSVGRWMRVAAIPVLVALALGKASLALGGDGMGAPSDAAIAVRYAGAGPWSDPYATTPTLPSQLLEAAAVLLVLLVVVLLAQTRFGRSGRLFAVSVALWALARAAVASTWRDSTVAGPLRAEQLLCLAIAIVSLVLLFAPRLPAPAAGRRLIDDTQGP